jgi:glutathione S-transferase
VPVLVHDGQTIWESLAILEALAELFPDKGFWPADRKVRAHARSVAAEMHGGFRALRYGWPMNLRRPPSHKPLDGEGERDRRRIEAVWRDCRDKYAGEGPFLFGPFTAADAMYAPVVTRFERYGGALEGPVRGYVETMLALPAMREWYAGAAAEPWPEPSPDE